MSDFPVAGMKKIMVNLIIFTFFCSCASAPKAGDFFRRGGVRYNDKDYAGAIEEYDRAQKLQPKNAQVYFNRGLAKAKKGNYPGAISDMQAATTLGNEQAMDEIKRIEKESKVNPAVKAPKGLTAVLFYNGVKLAWDKNTDSNASMYSVYMSRDPAKGYKLAAEKIRDNTAMVEDLKPGVKYYFVVTSMSRSNHDIESAYSNEASATAK